MRLNGVVALSKESELLEDPYMRCYTKVPRLTLGKENEVRYGRVTIDGARYMHNKYI